MKIYDTNLSKFDSMALKTCLLFYLFANCEPDKVSKIVLSKSQTIVSDGLGTRNPAFLDFGSALKGKLNKTFLHFMPIFWHIC